jgi:hypothetical protein
MLPERRRRARRLDVVDEEPAQRYRRRFDAGDGAMRVRVRLLGGGRRRAQAGERVDGKQAEDAGGLDLVQPDPSFKLWQSAKLGFELINMIALPIARPMGTAKLRMCAVLRVLALLLAVARPGASQDVSTQVWPEIDTFVRLGENMRIYVPVSKTREGTDDSDQDGTTGVYFDYYTSPILPKLNLTGPSNVVRLHRLLLRVGYSYTAGDSGEPATSTLVAEATGRLSLPWALLASDRSRFDLNFSGGDFDPRYRNRIRLERNVDLGKSSLTPYVYGEFFYDFDDGDWLKTRVTAGLEFHFWERFVPEVYFQRDYGSGSGGDVKGVGLVLSIYLR